MWISKMISQSRENEKAEKGSVTISAGAAIEVEATLAARGMESYTPYGYQANMPVGEEVMLLPSGNGRVIVGSRDTDNTLESGEIRITSLSGASIYLRSDGSVVINSLVIDKNGVIRN